LKKLHNRSEDPAREKRLQEILDLLYSFYDQEIDMSLERVERFLAQLGNPHLKLPPVIHIAGTNGKGSTLAILQSMLEASGKNVHKMTSPHLVHPTERIVLNGEPITTEYLIELLEECLAVNRTEPITFFEIFTAASFLAMSRHEADYVLLETGMGGRLDATNVIPNPILTIITTISIDHEKFLGHTLQAIAREKAGILKSGVPCIIGQQTESGIKNGVLDVFQEISQGLPTEPKLYSSGAEWSIEPFQDDLQMQVMNEEFIVPHTNLLGIHQMYNQGAAIAAYKVIMDDQFDASFLSPENQNNPLWNVFWPGRLQKLNSGPYVEHLKSDQELWIDGGHNDSAGTMLANQAREWEIHDNKPLTLILAMVDRKNPTEFLAPILPYCEKVIVTKIEDESASFEIEELYDLCKILGCSNITKASSVLSALDSGIVEPNARILVAGSLFLIGNILSDDE